MQTESMFGTRAESLLLLQKRSRVSMIWKVIFIFATAVAVLFLLLLLISVIDSVFGYIVVRNEVEVSALVSGASSLDELSRSQLEEAAKNNLSSGILRRVESEKPLAERTDRELRSLIEQYIIKPSVLKSWGLWGSITKQDEIGAFMADQADSYLIFKSWITPEFLINDQSANPLNAGIRTAMLGSLWIIAITFLLAFPIGVGSAIYLEEYADDTKLNRLLQLNIFNLSAVPSIIYGLLGLAVFVRALEGVTSGAIFSSVADTTANGRTILSGGLTLGLLVLPIIIINTQEALKGVPDSLRMSSYGVGATKWQTIWSHVLPASFDRILTGTILALSRALGETAPLVVIGASTFISVDPASIFSKFTTLPIQIYQWSARPQGSYRNIAAAAIIVLLVLLLVLNSGAIYLRDKLSKKKRMAA
ncbi:MAG: phosphate transport system permease protein [Sphaerochaeta sp.]|jgi:phosphate transport system permease protein|uniref:Phosphate transport system permease protein PstA n=2 Tax=Sphaerochaeta halotolerans TaxID=2293840 RepID=A0A372MHC2_9SPIR|nr:phosphate ABC transporter permease PstA [Spirochaetaceae bacterium]MDK2860029.1 phosphate transport system permease protein [Sphaerochaeta sp.]RFU95181.1 phosphate ABC transporter permease PstA [Sphaerochaeta halotolerans]